MDLLTLALQVFILFLTIYGYYHWKFRNLPPGPYGIPLVGYLPFLGRKPHKTIMNLSAKYGNIMSINMADGQQTIVVNDWDGINQVLVKQGDSFSWRPYLFIFRIIFQGRDSDDIVTTSGPATTELKRTSMKILKEFGMGRSSIENLIVPQVDKLIVHLTELDGQAVDVSHICFIPLVNIVWRLISGSVFDENDTEMKSFADNIHAIGSLNAIGILNVWPFLRHIAPQLTGFKVLNHASKKILAYIDKVVDQHWNNSMTVDKDTQERTDFIHRFIEEIKKRGDGQHQPPLSKNNLVGVTYNMFIAGLETIDTTLYWSLLLMAYYPDIQDKVHQELDKIIEKDSHLSYASKTLIPFTEATLLEVQRFASVLPLSIPHCPTKDVNLFGYKIPKGTKVITNLWALHHDPNYWNEPHEFRPERFLNDDGQLIKRERLIPFSAGPRMCLAKPLAKMELTLFFTGMLRRFSFEIDPKYPKTRSMLEPDFGIVLRPHSVPIIVKSRCEIGLYKKESN